MIALECWLPAVAAYVLFLLWYQNWRGPLTRAEIDAFMAEARVQDAGKTNDLDIVRAFLEKDDGREFVMLNLVRIAPGMVADPETGAPTPGRVLMNRYSTPFIKRLILRGGHPAIVARKVGGYVDAWHVAPDPGWTIMGYMRYRSRRDMAKLAFDPRFRDIHKFKIAGTAETFSFPTQPMLTLFVGPRIWVPLALALMAAVANLAAIGFG